MIARFEQTWPVPAPRWTFLIVALGCAFLMAVALYMEHQMDLAPCPLCILQRVAVIAVGAVALLASVHGPETLGTRIYGAMMVLVSVVGGGVSTRQLWLQSLPEDEVPACGASLDYMLEVFPLTDVLSMVLAGDGTCAEIVWTFLGISIPGWTLVAFVGLAIAGGYQVLRPAAQPGTSL